MHPHMIIVDETTTLQNTAIRYVLIPCHNDIACSVAVANLASSSSLRPEKRVWGSAFSLTVSWEAPTVSVPSFAMMGTACDRVRYKVRQVVEREMGYCLYISSSTSPQTSRCTIHMYTAVYFNILTCTIPLPVLHISDSNNALSSPNMTARSLPPIGAPNAAPSALCTETGSRS